MKVSDALCLLIFVIVSALQQGVTARRPLMFPAGEIVIQEGERLMILCKGEGGRSVNFTTQKLTVPVEQSNFTISHDEISNMATFFRAEAKGEDAGWYACAADDVEVKNDEQTVEHPGEDISWLYVYVKTSQPFAVMDALYDFIPPAFAGGDAVIPCRPTSPELNVTLHTESSQGVVSEQPPFDPRIGFTLKNVQKRQGGENFRCEASGFDDDTFWPVYSMHVADPNPLQKPRIDQEAARHVVSGQSLSLHCSISVPAGTMFSLVWEPPASIPQERFVHKPMQRTQEKDIWETVLTVTNVEKGDAGEYICVANPALGVKARSSIIIPIPYVPVHYINVTMDGNNQIISLERETFKWNIKVDTVPEEFQLKWFTPSGTLIEAETTEEGGKYSHTKNGSYHDFSVSYLSPEDSGNYSIEIRTSTDEKILIRQLTVIPTENDNCKNGKELLIIEKQMLRMAEAQERAVVAQERTAKLIELFIQKMDKRFFP